MSWNQPDDEDRDGGHRSSVPTYEPPPPPDESAPSPDPWGPPPETQPQWAREEQPAWVAPPPPSGATGPAAPAGMPGQAGGWGAPPPPPGWGQQPPPGYGQQPPPTGWAPPAAYGPPGQAPGPYGPPAGWVPPPPPKSSALPILLAVGGVGLVVILLLAAIAVPAFLGARHRAQDRAAQSQLRSAYAALEALHVDEQAYSDDLSVLRSEEPSIGWTTDGVGGPDDVQVLVADSAAGPRTRVAIGTWSESGRCFYLRANDAAQGVEFAQEEADGPSGCDLWGADALPPAVPPWSHDEDVGWNPRP